MEISAFVEYIKPELLVLVPVLYLVGTALKKAETVPDNKIPLLLGGTGVLLAAVWILPASAFNGFQAVSAAFFSALTQGILCAGAAVYADQLVKQAKK